MAKKTKSAKKEKQINYQTKLPEKTLRSKGYFYPAKRERADGSIAVRVIFESWRDGKRKTEQVPKRICEDDIGITGEMTYAEVQKALKDYSIKRKKEVKVDHSQIRAFKRLETIKLYDKTFFPPDYVEEFVSRLMSASDGKPRFKKRLLRCFEIVQKMVVELSVLPVDYESNLDRFVSYFKNEDRKYSVSYCKDILWVLNKWGHFFSRKRKTFFEPIGKLRTKTQNKITSVHNEKVGVRRASKPMTPELLKELRSKINTDKIEELNKYHWVLISFVFGLRPSECDSVLKDKNIEYDKGIPTLVVVQTKLTVVEEHEKEKRIPVICQEQADALELIKKGQGKRPTPKWLAEHLKEFNKFSEIHDLYCGRKGFTDFMISKGQSLENISMFLGHKNIQTSWKFYKDRKRVDFNPTDFATMHYKKASGR